jgi:competence protein ComEA
VGTAHEWRFDMRHALVTLVAFVIVAVVSMPAQAGQAKSAGKTPKASTQVVNVNSASAADFEALPGIGPKLAARIVDYRQKNGPFKKIEDLMNVQGLGEKNFLKLKSQLTIGAAKAASQLER